MAAGAALKATTDDSAAAALVRDALVWDNVWPVDLKDNMSFGNDWGKLERFAAAGVNAIGLTLAGDNHNITQAMDLVAWARGHLLAHTDKYVLAETVDDILKAQGEGKLAIVLQFEGMRCFERNLDMIEAYYKLGVRQTLLAFNNANSIGGGCAEENDGGLTNLGRRFVDALQDGGIFIDLSHVGRRTSLEALERARLPMAFMENDVTFGRRRINPLLISFNQ